MARAQYSILVRAPAELRGFVGAEARVAVLRDLGPWTQFPTITNDAESVIADLVRLEVIEAGIRLFYYDSDGLLDELVHDGKAFTGFAPGPR